jgi:hypothetical protein
MLSHRLRNRCHIIILNALQSSLNKKAAKSTRHNQVKDKLLLQLLFGRCQYRRELGGAEHVCAGVSEEGEGGASGGVSEDEETQDEEDEETEYEEDEEGTP